MPRGDLDKLKQAIETLERLQQRYQLPRLRRGRTGMGLEERKAASARVTRYWQARRARHLHRDDGAS